MIALIEILFYFIKKEKLNNLNINLFYNHHFLGFIKGFEDGAPVDAFIPEGLKPLRKLPDELD